MIRSKIKKKGKIRILMLTRGMFIGGAELVIENLCRSINTEKFEIGICYLQLDGPSTDKLRKIGVDVFGIQEIINHRSKYLSFYYLSRFVKQHKIDIIHSHGTASLFEAALCKIVTPKLKHIHTFHYGNYPHMDYKNLLFEKLSYRVPDLLVAVGNEQKKQIKKTFAIRGAGIDCIWNGILEHKEKIDLPLMKRIKKDGGIVIGSLSTLIEQKGISLFLDAIEHIVKTNSNIIVLIIGDGPLRNELEEKTNRLNLGEKVIFTGWVEDAANTVLPLLDIFCQSSLWEAMSMVVLEAMAKGIPSVVTDVGENRHIIKDGYCGYVVKANDSKAMAIKVQNLIVDEALRKTIGQNAKNRARKKFTAKIMAEMYEKRYRNLVA